MRASVAYFGSPGVQTKWRANWLKRPLLSSTRSVIYIFI